MMVSPNLQVLRKNQLSVDIIFASGPGLGFPNCSPEAGQRKRAKGAGFGNDPDWHSGNVGLKRSCLAEAERDGE